VSTPTMTVTRRTIDGSLPKYSARPPQTPARTRFERER
jgi:hypothetical protein